MSFDLESTLSAVSSAARDWSRREYRPRRRATEATLKCENAFTQQAIDAAIDWSMHCLRDDQLRLWVDSSPAKSPRDVVVLNAGNVPFVGLQDFLAVVLSGNRYSGVVSTKTPHFLPAFAASVREREESLCAHFCSLGEAIDTADLLLATGNEATMRDVRRLALSAGLEKDNMLLRGARYSVAVLDGNESQNELDGLAEDCLLHEGRGCLNVALVFAPFDIELAELAQSCERFRTGFPPHEATIENVALESRLLEATGRTCLEGSGFLLVDSDPNVRMPGVIVCARYGRLHDIEEWLERHEPEIQAVVTSNRRLETRSLMRCDFGWSQRPPVDWRPDGIDTLTFLTKDR